MDEIIKIEGRIIAAQLAITGNHTALGEVTLGQAPRLRSGQALRIIAVHDGLHRRDIQRLLTEVGPSSGEGQ